MYTKTTASNGRVMYRKDNKIVSLKDIPQEEVYRMEGLAPEQVKQLLTVDQTQSVTASLKQVPVCIFGGDKATTSKYINGNTVLLCDEHYKTRTTGEIAEQMRNNNASGPTTQ